MAVLGLVLIALAVLFGLGVSVSSSASTTMEVFGVDFGVSVPTVFFLGALAGAALLFGVWLTKKGLGRDLRRRKEMRELRATKAADEPPAIEQVERPATEETVETDPSEHKQPH
ncbi:hypothetical protein EV646_105140 [Kribbella antiqua]|uniref:Uncharacterized protein n=1 Tax=Kribbella antiqua TaxID=2512217 RepID=A0A4R2IRJ5_9ACTN|nr:hypothetical protein [Kribbella antiqua]TCO47587.1 hypothetical protein EV646_105140 [Kribbella antiqua]